MKNAFLLALCLLAFPVAAQDAKSCAANTKKPFNCLAAKAEAELYICSLKMSIAVMKGGADLQCGTELRALIAPYYAEATKRAGKRKETVALLKDYCAAFDAAIDSLLPGASETKRAYEARIEAEQRALSSKGSRLRLED